jgi:hypothetical protein
MKRLVLATAVCAALASALPAGVSLAQTAGSGAAAPPSAGTADQAGPDASKPDTGKSDASKPDVSKPDAASPTPPAAGPVPLKPGSVRVTTRAPDPDRWDGQKNAAGTLRIFKCKPLACSDAETITITFAKSPTRHPDPQALDKLAKVDLPKNIRAADAAREVLSNGDAKVDTLTSKTATLKTYPAVVNESRFTQGKKAVYFNTALIFAGPVMIRLQSMSQNRDLAQKTLNDFVEAMKIEEGPPLAPGAPEPGAVPATSGKPEEL